MNSNSLTWRSWPGFKSPSTKKEDQGGEREKKTRVKGQSQRQKRETEGEGAQAGGGLSLCHSILFDLLPLGPRWQVPPERQGGLPQGLWGSSFLVWLGEHTWDPIPNDPLHARPASSAKGSPSPPRLWGPLPDHLQKLSPYTHQLSSKNWLLLDPS